MSCTQVLCAFEERDSVTELQPFEVTEKVSKAPVQLLPLDVTLVSGAQIEQSREANVLPVLQHHVPGMFVTQRGLAGYGVSTEAAGSVSVRGVGGVGKVLFLIDGQPQWAGIFGHSLPDTYVSGDIQDVEVVSGPASLLYGSGAMGGSVNLITRRATDNGLSGALRAMAGSYGTMNCSGRLGYKSGKLRALVSAGYDRSDGSRRGMGYWLANQYINLEYDFSKHWAAGADVMVTETRADNAGSVHESTPKQMWTKMLRTTYSLFVKNRYSFGNGGLQAYWNWGRHKVDDGLSNGQPRDYLFHSKDYNMGITAYETLNLWTGNDLSLGVDFKHWGGNAWNAKKADGTRTDIVDKHVNELAGYAMMQQSFLSDILRLNAGVRLEHSSQFGNEWVPQAGFVFAPLQNGQLKFSYGKGFRSPNIRELYMYGPRNADLKPERMNNFEVELRHRFIPTLETSLALYYINGENMIQTVMTDGKPLNVNTGKFINKGFEAEADWSITREWEIGANYAYLHTSKRIVSAPRNKLYGEVSYTPGPWEFNLNMQGIWGLYTEESKEDYVLLGARAAYHLRLPAELTFFVKGENLTATKYEINYGFPMPRATVMAGAEIKF
jgi:outer membrane receptor protein involved in Fe transport